MDFDFDDDPVEVLHNLNTVHSQKLGSKGNRFCTVIFGLLTRSDDGFDVVLASGGHPPPLLLYADGSAYYVDTTGGQAVGITSEPHFTASRFHLAPGDSLLVYTDGMTEARNPAGEEYGVARMKTLVANCHKKSPDHLIADCLEDLKTFTNGNKPTDDLTLLAIQRTAEA